MNAPHLDLRRAERLFWALVVVALAALTLLPLFLARDPPLLDSPSHLAWLHIWRYLDDPRFGYADHFELSVAPVPYFGYYGFVHLASFLLPLRLANKLFLGLTLLAVPAGLYLLLRALRRPPVLALAGFLLAWNCSVAWGFLATSGAFGFLLAAYALLVRLDDAPAPWPGWLLAANALVGIGFAFFHPVPFVMWLLGVAALSWRRGYLALPAILVFAWEFSLSPPAARMKEQLFVQAWINRPTVALEHLFTRHLFGFFGEGFALRLALAAVAALVAAGLLVRRAGSGDRRPYRLALLLAAGYFLLPVHIQRPIGFAMFSIRFGVMVALAALACVPAGTLPGWRALAALAPFVAATVVYDARIASAFAEVGARERDLYAVVERLPYRPRVLTLVYDAEDPDLDGNIWRKSAGYVQVERGGTSRALWEETGGIGQAHFPVTRRPGPRPPAPPLDQPLHFDWKKQGPFYDYFLTRGQPKGTFPGQPALEVVAEQGDWRLWRRATSAGRAAPAQ